MRILIYGNEAVGSLLYELFYNKGYSVERYNENVAISSFDVLFICVPWNSFERALEEVCHKAKKEALLVDTLQEKDLTIPILEGSGFDYLSVYPLIQATTESKITDVLVVRKSGKREENVVLDEFAKNGLRVVEMSLHEYQKWLVEDQALVEFFLLALIGFKARIANDTGFLSPLSEVLHVLSSDLLRRNPQEIQRLQQKAEDIREAFVNHVFTLHEDLKEENKTQNLLYELKARSQANEQSSLIFEALAAARDVEDVSQMRNSIRSIDRFILELLERRIEIAQKIAREKSERNEAVEVREVEEEKMREILSKTSLNPLLTKEIFELIMKLTKEEEYKALGISKTVAVLGPRGSFSEEMGLKLVGSRAPLRYCFTTDEIIKLVESEEVDYGIAPIENSTNGTVFPVLDALMSHDVEVFGESKLEINQCLVAKRKLKLNDIKRVFSHPQAVAQCMGFLNNYLPNAEIRYTSSTSDAASLLDDYSAAIMSENGARLHKLYVLRKGIQDLKQENITRFYIIRKRTGKTGGRVTSLFFSVEDRPGSLKDALEVFQRKGFNLRKLESRPAKTVLGDYVFFVEVEAPLSEEDLRELREVTAFYKVIGVFDTIERLNVYE